MAVHDVVAECLICMVIKRAGMWGQGPLHLCVAWELPCRCSLSSSGQEECNAASLTCAGVLGAEKTLELLLAPLQDATSAGEGNWRTIEAGLYCVRAVHRCRLAAQCLNVCPSLRFRCRTEL